MQCFIGARQPRVGWIILQRQRQPIGSGDADQRRAAHHHGADAVGSILHRAPRLDGENMRQPRLVDDLDRAVLSRPDRAIWLSVYLHASISSTRCSTSPNLVMAARDRISL